MYVVDNQEIWIIVIRLLL